MTYNHIILGVLLVGILLLIISWQMDSKSNFDDGSFMIQMLLMILGSIMVVGGLVCKLITSLV